MLDLIFSALGAILPNTSCSASHEILLRWLNYILNLNNFPRPANPTILIRKLDAAKNDGYPIPE
ncbi:MAG: hypothetical protein ACI9ND_002866 [Yoonia sp.]